MKKRLTALVMIIMMAVTMMPFAASAESGEQSGNTNPADPPTTEQQGENGQQGEDVQQAEDTDTDEQADSEVTLYRGKMIKGKWGGTIVGIKGNTAYGKDLLKFGQQKVYRIIVFKGYKIKNVYVNGISQGKVNEVTLKGDGHPQRINAIFQKGKIRIMLDAGHAGYYNRGVIKKYWESKMTWRLTNYLKKDLEAYGIKCGMTKKSLRHDPSVYGRGRKAKGYDLFISIHSNWAPSPSTDYPLAIVSSKYKKRLYKKAQPLGKKLVKTIRKTMKTRQKHMVWVRRERGGKDWYGVIRGAASVNVPAIILEHSFHSNRKKCKWLLKKKNLKMMAAAEAKTIAKHYGYISK